MKIFHTADWHLGKLVQGVYMTDDQAYVLEQFYTAIEEEQPDAIIIAGDLYDRAVPPTDAVALFDEALKKIVVDLKVPVLAIAGNHDSPGRLQFGSEFMRENGFYIVGQMTEELTPVVLNDEYGEVHFHLVPFADPSIVRNLYGDEEIRNHHDAMEKITARIHQQKDEHARHVFVGHAFVTPHGESEENTSDSERPIAIGGAEYVAAHLFDDFHYTALGHLHRAHYVRDEKIRYAGSPLKYSISEEQHEKGFYVVTIDGEGQASVDKRTLIARRNMRTIEATIDEINTHEPSDDYVFVKLLDKTPVMHPMEKVRAIYPNAMHVERKIFFSESKKIATDSQSKSQLTDVELFEAFYEEMKGEKADEETIALFEEVLHDLLYEEGV